MNKRTLAVRCMTLTLAAVSASPYLTMCVPVYAQEEEGITSRAGVMVTQDGVITFNAGDASIVVHPNQADQTLVGKSFRIYKLLFAENSEDMKSVNYTFNDTCKDGLQRVVGKAINKTASEVTEYEVIDYIQSLNNFPVEGAAADQQENGYYSEFRYFIEELRNMYVDLGKYVAREFEIADVREDGSILIQGLDYGYYLLDEVTFSYYSDSASSLCIVDTANPLAQVSVKSDYPSLVKKIQDDVETDAETDGWSDMADFEIGQTVPYRFTSNIPNINGYETYYYAWHDLMDEALTFHADSVKITISDAEGIQYTLSEDEYTVEDHSAETNAEETFSVSIQDIKAIVDKHFDKIDDLGHNTYGQTVTLTYQATLNDLAALRTGISGFENMAVLGFSNNPDSDGVGETGVTAADSVVCFTYRLDGIKVNNYGDALENAKFRLYADEACSDEVYVKKNADGEYIVMHDDTADGTKPETSVEMISNAGGEFHIIGLDQGTYYLKETEAPKGYRQLSDPIVLTITPEFTENRNNYIEGDAKAKNALIDLSANAHVKEFLSGTFKTSDIALDTEVETGTVNLRVVNTAGAKLPVTGSAVTLTMFCVGSGLMVVSGIRLRKKREQDEQ